MLYSVPWYGRANETHPLPPQPNISGVSEYVLGHGKKNLANVIKCKEFYTGR